MSWGAGVHTAGPMLEVPAGDTAAGVALLGAPPQALLMATLALRSTGTVLTVGGTHWRRKRERRKMVKSYIQNRSISSINMFDLISSCSIS